jgi:hypothetical protein
MNYIILVSFENDAYQISLSVFPIYFAMFNIHGPRYFSCVDLASGYWQVELQEEHKEKTAFSTPYRLY